MKKRQYHALQRQQLAYLLILPAIQESTIDSASIQNKSKMHHSD